MQTQLFDSISVEIPYDKIYHRLGYRRGLTKIVPREKKEIERHINDAAALLPLRGIASRIAIEVTATQTILATGDTFNSKLLANLLKGAKEMFCMAVTGGSKIIQAVHALEKDDLKLGVIYDATASEMVDAGFEWIQKYYNQALTRENLRLIDKRISCGYGDFSLRYQKIFYELLGLERLSITMTKAYMLVPEKSATAVTAIVEAR